MGADINIKKGAVVLGKRGRRGGERKNRNKTDLFY